MKSAEVRDLDTEELHLRIAELKEELFNLRFQHATGQLDNHRRIRECKRDVARMRTILRERDFAAAEAARAGTPGGSGGSTKRSGVTHRSDETDEIPGDAAVEESS